MNLPDNSRAVCKFDCGGDDEILALEKRGMGLACILYANLKLPYFSFP